jgi:hypothetical protein
MSTQRPRDQAQGPWPDRINERLPGDPGRSLLAPLAEVPTLSPAQMARGVDRMETLLAARDLRRPMWPGRLSLAAAVAVGVVIGAAIMAAWPGRRPGGAALRDQRLAAHTQTDDGSAGGETIEVPGCAVQALATDDPDSPISVVGPARLVRSGRGPVRLLEGRLRVTASRTPLVVETPELKLAVAKGATVDVKVEISQTVIASFVGRVVAERRDHTLQFTVDPGTAVSVDGRTREVRPADGGVDPEAGRGDERWSSLLWRSCEAAPPAGVSPAELSRRRAHPAAVVQQPEPREAAPPAPPQQEPEPPPSPPSPAPAQPTAARVGAERGPVRSGPRSASATGTAAVDSRPGPATGSAPPAPPAPVVPVPEESSVVRTESPAPSPEEAPLAREAELIARAQRALRSQRDVPGALAALDEHRRRFATGALSPERDVLRLEALLKTGRDQEALAFLRSAPLDRHARGRELRVLRGELWAARPDGCVVAVVDFTSALTGDRSRLEERALFGRASCRLALGQLEAGHADLAKYLERFPSGLRAAEVRARLAEQHKDPRKDPRKDRRGSGDTPPNSTGVSR